MNSMRLISTLKKLFLVLCFAFISNSLNAQCTHPDYDALMALYNSTNGQNWTYSNGWVDGAEGTNCDPCTWGGIDCYGGDRVRLLWLNSNNLSGFLPPEIVDLTFLEGMNLDNNNISDLIPLELTQLSLINTLVLSNNEFSGTIPADIGQLSNLTSLHLAGNNLSGTIPIEVTQLMNLGSLDLGNNLLSGNIPLELGQLNNLWLLDLGGNLLTGNIPSELGQLTNLSSLFLTNNQLSGTLPDELCQLQSANIYLAGNNLEGCIPESYYSPCSDSWITFSNNPLLPWQGDYQQYCASSGSIADQIGAFCDDGDSTTVNDVINADCTCGSLSTSIAHTSDIESDLIEVYPNPAEDYINLIFLAKNKLSDDSLFSIRDVNGKVMYSADAIVLAQEYIDVSSFQKGIYFIHLESDAEIYTSKFLKL